MSDCAQTYILLWDQTAQVTFAEDPEDRPEVTSREVIGSDVSQVTGRGNDRM